VEDKVFNKVIKIAFYIIAIVAAVLYIGVFLIYNGKLINSDTNIKFLKSLKTV